MSEHLTKQEIQDAVDEAALKTGNPGMKTASEITGDKPLKWVWSDSRTNRLLGGPKLFAAFSKFQGAVGTIGRGSSGQIGHQQYKYSPLETVVAAIKEPMTDNGLSYTQMVNNNTVSTFIFHDSGEILENITTFPEWAMADTEGKGEPIQRAALVHTYLKRYALLATIGKSPDDEDSDGANKKTGKVEKLSDEQKATIKLTKQLKACATEKGLTDLWGGSQDVKDAIKNKSTIGFAGVEKVYEIQLKRLRPFKEDTVEDIHSDETKRMPE